MKFICNGFSTVQCVSQNKNFYKYFEQGNAIFAEDVWKRGLKLEIKSEIRKLRFEIFLRYPNDAI